MLARSSVVHLIELEISDKILKICVVRIFAERKRDALSSALIRNECSRMSSIKGISKHFIVLYNLGQDLFYKS